MPVPWIAASWIHMDLSAASGATGPSRPIPPDQARELGRLRAADQQVRAHEAAHLAAAGGLARGGAAYTYERGPDGRSYAVAGEVSLDTSPVPSNPAATLAKAQQIQAAALAPADPSPQDRAVAAAAAKLALQAQAELQRKTGAGPGTSVDLLA